ncbi:hypothetical protein KP509_12G053000 [Ceratopteris richardii]|uniref:Uncharacterized protein n=1 Tax=Ceratopteris richardii TaxID=49495 RepID=A0A8T2TJ65_CERRI|nr:hypothetical protein KP509_12G053000 [Ceratopteris richardii]
MYSSYSELARYHQHKGITEASYDLMHAFHRL